MNNPLRRRTSCAHCGGALDQAPRGRPRIYCSDACKRKEWEKDHGVVTLTPEQWRSVERALTTGGTTAHGDEHAATIGAVIDRIEQMLAWAREDWGDERAGQVLVAIGAAVGPYARRLLRGRTAHDGDLCDLNRRLDEVYDIHAEYRRRHGFAARQAALSAAPAVEAPEARS